MVQSVTAGATALVSCFAVRKFCRQVPWVGVITATILFLGWKFRRNFVEKKRKDMDLDSNHEKTGSPAPFSEQDAALDVLEKEKDIDVKEVSHFTVDFAQNVYFEFDVIKDEKELPAVEDFEEKEWDFETRDNDEGLLKFSYEEFYSSNVSDGSNFTSDQVEGLGQSHHDRNMFGGLEIRDLEPEDLIMNSEADYEVREIAETFDREDVNSEIREIIEVYQNTNEYHAINENTNEDHAINLEDMASNSEDACDKGLVSVHLIKEYGSSSDSNSFITADYGENPTAALKEEHSENQRDYASKSSADKSYGTSSCGETGEASSAAAQGKAMLFGISSLKLQGSSEESSYEARLGAYDEYLSNPRLSSQLRSQVMRARAALKRFYDAKT